MDAAAKHNLVGKYIGFPPFKANYTDCLKATYGYLDGEYIFSAALLLIMVNAAFPHNETNSRAMEMALNLLRGMADRGNTYLGSRHSLLLELQSTVGLSRAKREDVVVEAPVTPNTIQQPPPSTNVIEEQPLVASPWPLQQDLPSMRDITFNFDINDDPGLWEEVLHQIDIDMDTDWIENTLRK
jgi:hypothetical protein